MPEEVTWINPVDGIITSSCGRRINPVLNREEYHNGLDIAIPENTDVIAVRDGVVTEVRTSQTLGNLVKYTTEDGYIVMYAHLNKVIVSEGDSVSQGETIALSGNTGLSTGPHLHYSVWKEDMLMDPMQFVELRFTQEVVEEYTARGANIR